MTWPLGNEPGKPPVEAAGPPPSLFSAGPPGPTRPPGQAAVHWAGLFVPVVLFLAPLGLLTLFRPDLALKTSAFYPIAAVSGVDASVIAGTLLGFEWWYVVLWVMWGQMLLCAFLLRNLELLRRWGPAGRLFKKIDKRAVETYRKRPSLERFAFWGLCWFTLLPVGTGIYVGVVLGKILGLSDVKTWLSLMIGTAAFVIVLAYAATHAMDAVVGFFG